MDRNEVGFAKFPDLPYDLRSQIWGELMPAPAIYLVECDAVLVDNTDDQDGRNTLRLALRPAHHRFKVCGLGQRVRTQKVLLATCVESRRELCRHFPDTLGDGGPRFSLRHDLVYIGSDFFHYAFVGYTLPLEVRLEFEGGWNEVVQRLALNCEVCQFWSYLARRPAAGFWQDRDCARIKRFMEFLATCTSLRQFVLTTSDGIGFDAWAELSRGERTDLANIMAECYGGLTCRASEQPDAGAGRLNAAVSFLRQIIFDDLDATIHRNWPDKIETGYPVLRDLEISKMVHVSPELRWLCKDL